MNNTRFLCARPAYFICIFSQTSNNNNRRMLVHLCVMYCDPFLALDVSSDYIASNRVYNLFVCMMSERACVCVMGHQTLLCVVCSVACCAYESVNNNASSDSSNSEKWQEPCPGVPSQCCAILHYDEFNSEHGVGSVDKLAFIFLLKISSVIVGLSGGL